MVHDQMRKHHLCPFSLIICPPSFHVSTAFISHITQHSVGGHVTTQQLNVIPRLHCTQHGTTQHGTGAVLCRVPTFTLQ